MIWSLVLLGRGVIDGSEIKWSRRSKCIAGFSCLFVLIDLLILTYWPSMSQSLVQAGMFYICNKLFACLQ
jgi:hypothetical protein